MGRCLFRQRCWRHLFWVCSSYVRFHRSFFQLSLPPARCSSGLSTTRSSSPEARQLNWAPHWPSEHQVSRFSLGSVWIASYSRVPVFETHHNQDWLLSSPRPFLTQPYPTSACLRWLVIVYFLSCQGSEFLVWRVCVSWCPCPTSCWGSRIHRVACRFSSETSDCCHHSWSLWTVNPSQASWQLSLCLKLFQIAFRIHSNQCSFKMAYCPLSLERPG